MAAAAAKVVVTTVVQCDAKSIYSGAKLHADDSTVRFVVETALDKAADRVQSSLIFKGVEAFHCEADLWVPLFIKTGRAPLERWRSDHSMCHVGIVQGSNCEPSRGPNGCGILVHDVNAAADPVSKSEKARL